MREDRPQMDTRTLLRERLRRSRDWSAAIDELEKELEASGTKPEQSERLCELAALVEDVIPERDRAIGIYQRAWKLHPANVRALTRAREVYGEIGRLEMVAKLGEFELRDPNSPSELAQIVGEVLDLPAEAVRVIPRDTDATPYDMGTLGSRSMFHMGHAVRRAAEEAREKLKALAREAGEPLRAAAVIFRVKALAGLEDRLASAYAGLWDAEAPELNDSTIELQEKG